MKLRIILYSIVVLTAALFLSAFGSPTALQTVRYQDTAVPPAATMPAATVPAATVPAVTVIVPTVVVQGTPVVVPVTGVDTSPGLWTLVLFGLLGLLAIAFLVALFSPRTTHEHIDRNPPPPPEV